MSKAPRLILLRGGASSIIERTRRSISRSALDQEIPLRLRALARTALLLLALSAATASAAEPSLSIDLAGLSTDPGVMLRVFGADGIGSSGVPVAGGLDCDGDSLPDYAMAAMRASPLGRSAAGEVYLVFGDGVLGGSLDTSGMQSRILKLAGEGVSEATGSEIWMDDVTGDGLGDLLIARQNFAPDPNRGGAGALTIAVGSPALRTHAATLQYLDLGAPPAGVTLTHVHGAAEGDRLGIWVRTGDVTGDGIADILIGADQEDGGGENDRGAAYLIRGGPLLAAGGSIDLAQFGATALAGHLARILPPVGAAEFHFGATCQIADLDDNGSAEVVVAAALNRAGAALQPAGTSIPAHSTGGTANGTVYIAWDDCFAGNPWPSGLSIDMGSAACSRTTIDGAGFNQKFGEELLGGLDYDDDGLADLFVGDLLGDGSAAGDRPKSGTAHVFYDAASLRGLHFDLAAPPFGVALSTFIGAEPIDIAGDTAAHGDFDGDGVADLAFSSPHATVLGRVEAGALHVFFGQSGGWPALVDLTPGLLPAPSAARIARIYGANGEVGIDGGDMLAYSAAVGDIDGDGRIDLIVNEMLGNGIAPASLDAGNLLVLSGALISPVVQSVPALPRWAQISLLALGVSVATLALKIA